MKLVDAYNYLIKIRWQDAVLFSTNIEDHHFTKVLPPLTIQMLIENVIKHNTISKSQPVKITLSVDQGNYLVIKNTKRIKRVDFTIRRDTNEEPQKENGQNDCNDKVDHESLGLEECTKSLGFFFQFLGLGLLRAGSGNGTNGFVFDKEGIVKAADNCDPSWKMYVSRRRK